MELTEILVQEVLLRLPPAEPASFLRAATVCKHWHHIIFARNFVRRLHEFHRIDSAFAWARGEEMEEGELEAAAAVTTPPTLRRSQRLARMSAATTPTPMHRSARKAVEMTPPTLRRSQRLLARKGAATLPPPPAALPSPQEAAESIILVSGSRRSVYRASKLISKYKKQIEEPTIHTMKSNEYSMASSSVYYVNLELVRLKKELHQKSAEVDRLDEALGRESDQRRNVSQRYENDKKLWAAAISNMEKKIKAMKEKQALLSLEAHECANAIPDLSKMTGSVQALVAQCEDLKWKYCEEMDKRKKLYNILLETKGNIRVFCRCRPLSKHEVSSGQKCVVNFDGANDGDILITNTGTAKKTFKFDRVFTPKHDQDVVYADVSPLVTSVLDGYNLCIFAYGQTGTGKTFTMEGTESNRGVNYRALEELIKIAEARKESVTYEFSVSVLEVYNEQIRDLLSTSPPKKLEMKQDREGAISVAGLVEAKVNNIKEVWDFLQAGSNARTVGSNNVNKHSSRSHCMLSMMVRAKNLVNGECTSSKLCLVDLAGSERLAKTDVQGERLKEAQNINKSLAALGDVISALSTKSSHIPYRNSKLTHLLQDSLGGDSKVLMFVQISPSDNDVSETLSSLNFASRVCRIELGLAKKQVDTAEFQKTKHMLERAKQEIRVKDDSLRKLEENLQNLESKAKGKEQLCENLQEKVKELEITSEKQHHQLSGKLKEKEEMCADLEQKITELKCKLNTQQSDSEVAVLNRTARELEHEPLETQRMEATLQVKLQDLESKTKVHVCRKRKATEPPVKNLERSTPASRATAAATRSAAPDSRAPPHPGRSRAGTRPEHGLSKR